MFDLNIEELQNQNIQKYWEELRGYGYIFLFFVFAYYLTQIFLLGSSSFLKDKFLKLFWFFVAYVLILNFTLWISENIYSAINYFL